MHDLLVAEDEPFNHTLGGILSGKGTVPYNMFDFYMYLDSRTNVLKFWLDATHHMLMCE
ncbi:Bud site selection protein, Revert to axial protein 1 [Oleoguttula sp. CCFEE 5521]